MKALAQSPFARQRVLAPRLLAATAYFYLETNDLSLESLDHLDLINNPRSGWERLRDRVRDYSQARLRDRYLPNDLRSSFTRAIADLVAAIAAKGVIFPDHSHKAAKEIADRVLTYEGWELQSGAEANWDRAFDQLDGLDDAQIRSAIVASIPRFWVYKATLKDEVLENQEEWARSFGLPLD